MDPQEIKKRIKETVLRADAGARVILFGSRARGSATAGSDWDILVLLNRPAISFRDEQFIRHKLYDVALEAEQPISTFVYSLKDWNTKMSASPLYANIAREGIIL